MVNLDEGVYTKTQIIQKTLRKKHNRNRLSRGPVFTFSLSGRQFILCQLRHYLWTCLLQSTTISLVSGYHHHPLVSHLPIHQDIWLDQKIVFVHHSEKHSMEQVVHSFWAKKVDQYFYWNWKRFNFPHIIITNIQMSLESSNTTFYIAKRYRISQ